MAFINGYKYNTEAEAIAARDEAATYAGYPKNNGTTLYWVDYNTDGVIWYIMHVEGLEEVLGEPTQIEIDNGII